MKKPTRTVEVVTIKRGKATHEVKEVPARFRELNLGPRPKPSLASKDGEVLTIDTLFNR